MRGQVWSRAVIEAVVMGRVGVDLYPAEGRPLREVRSFTRFVGGYAGNVSTGLARLGVEVAIVSRVGDDPHGEFVRDFLEAEGIDTRFLAVDPDWPTPPTFCDIRPPDDFPIYFYRRPTVPDWQLAPADFDAEEVAAAPLLYASGTGLAQQPSAATTLGAMRAHRGTTIFDCDWRPTLWQFPAAFPALAAEAASYADLVVGNEAEVEAARAQDARPLVLKRGPRGSTVFEADGTVTDVPVTPVEVVNGLGAGDAFGAALGYSLVRGLGLVEGVRLGSVAGAIVAGQLACSEAMPTLEALTNRAAEASRGS
jgi:5-dehydro-2-deoxygluconokinase